jgi:hypothetical protein
MTASQKGKPLTTLPVPVTNPIIVARFESRIDRSPHPQGCWTWTGATSSVGYGLIRVGQRVITAHRFANALWNGQAPERLTVDHQCHNLDASCLGGKLCQHRRCVNPNHLNAVTSGENTRRATARKKIPVITGKYTRPVTGRKAA